MSYLKRQVARKLTVASNPKTLSYGLPPRQAVKHGRKKEKRNVIRPVQAGPKRRAALPERGHTSTPRDSDEALFGMVTELLGGAQVFRHPPTTRLEAHEALRRGLPAQSMVRLLDTLDVMGQSEPALAKVLGTSLRTLQRQKKTPAKRLSQEQSGRMWKFAEVLAKATEVFGSQRDAEQWMKRPATGLEQRRPIELMETPAGAELVESFLERLEYGVYA
jgi:putative toxin-antitoxin system antitoxin component (TIGR02293 family)